MAICTEGIITVYRQFMNGLMKIKEINCCSMGRVLFVRSALLVY